MEIKLLKLSKSGDLCKTYVRRLNDDKLVHYTVPTYVSLINGLDDESDLNLIKNYIEKHENIKDLKINLEYSYELSKDVKRVDVSEILLKDHPDILKSLQKVQIKSQLYLYQNGKDFMGLWGFYNRFANFINLKFSQLFGKFVKLPLKQIREITPVTYLSVSFEEKEVNKAMATLLNDLKILQENKLIVGNLSMVMMSMLDDTLGIGKYFSLFCFPVVNRSKLLKKQNNSNKYDVSLEPLKKLGLKCVTFEGDSIWLDGKFPKSKYEIENVNITLIEDKEIQDQVIKCYDDSLETVNKVSKKMSEELKLLKKTGNFSVPLKQ